MCSVPRRVRRAALSLAGANAWCVPLQVLVRISDLTVIAGEARPAQIAEVIAWARAHRESFALKWAELNERGEEDFAAYPRRSSRRAANEVACSPG
jgi:hypothetical protein